MKNFSLLPRVWLVFFILIPLAYVFVLSFQTKGVYGGIEWTWALETFFHALSQATLIILLKTIALSFLTALLCTVLAGFCATFISYGRQSRRQFWMMVFLLPFLINSLVRLFSLQSFVGFSGPLQNFIRWKTPDFVATGWSHNSFLMFAGMVLSYLPFALLPLLAAYAKWDESLSEAASDLGASTWQTFKSVKWPLLKSAFLTSFLMVLIPSLGEYLVPEILEGAKNLYWGQYITEAFLKWRNWPLGSALGTLLIFSLLLFMFLSSWLTKKMAKGT